MARRAHSVYHSGMITLVHGTWPRGFFPKWLKIMRLLGLSKPKPLWFESESPFREKLEPSLKDASLDCEIRPFCWSGANSVFAREGAAQKLARVLKDDLKPSNAMPIVIAHSHGGNVALRAMTHLGADASRVRIVTLATPFLRVFVRKPVRVPFLVCIPLLVAMGGILMPIFMIFSALIWSATNEFTGSNSSHSPPDSWLFAAMAAGFVAGVIVTPRLSWFFINGWRGRARKIKRAATYDTRSDCTPRMFVIRGVDDEASLFLAAGAIGSRLSHIILFSVIPWIYGAGTALVVVLGLLFIDRRMVDSLLQVVFVVCALGALAFLLLPGLFKSAFGKELLIGTMRCDIAADSVPDTSQRVEAITLAPETGIPRHEIYRHPRCVSEIVGWLRPGR